MAVRSNYTRRGFLGAAIASALGAAVATVGRTLAAPGVPAPRRSFETARGSRVRWGRLKSDADAWAAAPEGDLAVVDRIRQVTNVNLSFDFGAPPMDDLDHMCEYPWIFANGQSTPTIRPIYRQNLREYLRRGGFLFVDDCVYAEWAQDAFYKTMRMELGQILPNAVEKNLAQDMSHEIFHCVYDIPVWPHLQGVNRGLRALYDRDRLVCLLTSSDIHCAWAGWATEAQQEQSIQMGVNMYIYAMTH
jgi:hypothetical protein